jgi:hypothetical protein
VISVSCGVSPIIALSFCEEILGGNSYTDIKKGDFSFKVSRSLRYQRFLSEKDGLFVGHELAIDNRPSYECLPFCSSRSVEINSHGRKTGEKNQF